MPFFCSHLCVGLCLSALLGLFLALPSVHRWHDEITPAPVLPPAPTRPPLLTRFLQTTDVDSAVTAAKAFEKEYRTHTPYIDSIRYLVDHEWTTQNQGIYNVLQHAYILPNDIKFDIIMKGLLEKDDIQYRLAAAIGVQFSSKQLEKLPQISREFRRVLLDYAAQPEQDDFLAARAFLAVKDLLLHPQDTKFVLALLGELNWRNALTWLLKNVHSTKEPLTSQRLRTLLKAAIEHEKVHGVGQSDPSVVDSPELLPWTKAWSDRLLKLDVEAVMDLAGSALDEHHSKAADSKSTVSKLSLYQEIDIPAYAPLLQGELGADGVARLAPDVSSSSSSSPAEPTTPAAASSTNSHPHQQPAASTSAGAASTTAATTRTTEDDKLGRAGAPYQPDAVLTGKMEL